MSKATTDELPPMRFPVGAGVTTIGKPKPIFIPLLDNGNGQVMSGFMMDHGAAFAGREIHMVMASDSLATRGMNKIANAFLATGCDIWINIDADIRFTKHDIDRLLSHDLPLVYGLYPKKSDSTDPCVCTFNEVPIPDERGLVVMRRAGRGFMLVHRKVLEAMKEDNGGPSLRYHNHGRDGEVEWDFFPCGVVTGEFSAMGDGKDKDGYPRREFLSEDWLFCQNAAKLGFKIYCDTGIALGHVGMKEYRFHGEQITNIDASRVKSWRDIDGWFDYEEVYRKLVELIPDNGRFVEVGTWMGKSIAAFLAFAKESEKRFEVHAVDTFQGKPANAHQEAVLNVHGGNVRKMFEANMKALGIFATDDPKLMGGDLVDVNVHAEDSVFAAKGFLPGTLDAVFIDGDHNEEAVYADIEAWAPKIKSGGILCGHDIDEQGVFAAVMRFFGTRHERIGRCWWVQM